MRTMLNDDDWSHASVMWEGAHRLVGRTDGWTSYTVDDTALLKQGRDSVGVQVQYAGCVGRNANCQAVVTLGIAQEHASAPLAARLFLPDSWTRDPERCRNAHVPEEIVFQTKTTIALDLVRRLDSEGLPHHPVLADSAFGDVVAFRKELTRLGFPWVVGIDTTTSVWPGGLEFAPRPQKPGAGRPVTRVAPTAPTKPQGVSAFAHTLPADAWQRVCWRDGSRGPQIARFAAVRVRPAHGWDNGGIPIDDLCEEAWLLLHWPEDKPAPTKAWLSSLPPETPIDSLVGYARLRWRVERDYQEGKGLAGLDHFEGRSWYGLHHHLACVLLAQQFLATERIAELRATNSVPPIPTTTIDPNNPLPNAGFSP
jgi:SRSO17 transposase